MSRNVTLAKDFLHLKAEMQEESILDIKQVKGMLGVILSKDNPNAVQMFSFFKDVTNLEFQLLLQAFGELAMTVTKLDVSSQSELAELVIKNVSAGMTNALAKQLTSEQGLKLLH